MRKCYFMVSKQTGAFCDLQYHSIQLLDYCEIGMTLINTIAIMSQIVERQDLLNEKKKLISGHRRHVRLKKHSGVHSSLSGLSVTVFITWTGFWLLG